MGISVSAKCKLPRQLELDKSRRNFDLSGMKPIKEGNEDFLENASTRTVIARSIHSIPRLQIPSESSSSSDIGSETIIKKADVDNIKQKLEAVKPREFDAIEWRPQILNSEQASLAWTCDIFSKESDQFALGWASQINSESISGFGNGQLKISKQTNYSPLVENEMQNSNSPPAHEPKLDLIVEQVPPKPKDRKNFIRKNVKEVKAKRVPNNGSYSQLMTATLQPSVETPSNIERITFCNLSVYANDQSTSPKVKLEHLLQDQRMDLIHSVDDFLRENSQETTFRSVSPEEKMTKPLSQPKVQRRPVKLVNFKNLNKFVKVELKHDQLKDYDDQLSLPWYQELSSTTRLETTSLQLPRPSEISIPPKVITPNVQENPKPFSNFKKSETAQSQHIPVKAKSKREIMMEYSKSVSAANLVLNKKTVPRIRTRPQNKFPSTLDEELARILQAHEEETKRIASLFLS